MIINHNFDYVHYGYKEQLEMMTMMMMMKRKMMMIMLTKPSSRPLQQLLVSVQRRAIPVVRFSTKVAKVLPKHNYNYDYQDEDEDDEMSNS